MARKKAEEEAAPELTREEKEAQEDAEALAAKYVEEAENRADDDPLKLQKRDAEPGEAVDVGEAPAEEPAEE